MEVKYKGFALGDEVRVLSTKTDNDPLAIFLGEEVPFVGDIGTIVEIDLSDKSIKHGEEFSVLIPRIEDEFGDGVWWFTDTDLEKVED